MKRKIFYLMSAFAIIFIIYFLSSTIKASTSTVNPECPNGCKPNGQYCYCNGDHPYLKEHHWEKQQ